ncbi:polysaccharide biosynthesis/export family protein [Pedosphaera parvula]|nr:SLBB domain-containing protein [Pedosphaera parvula]
MIKNSGRCLFGAAILVAGMLLIGCKSSDYKFNPLTDNVHPATATKSASAGQEVIEDPKAGVLHVGDKVTVSFSDIINAVQPITQPVKDDGSITLMYNQKFQAAGRTISDIEKEIHDRYVPAYYVNLTANIAIEERFFSVGGEVKSPNRQVYSGRITVTGAIDTAGGFTDFAWKSRIRLTRANGKQITVNYKKALEDPKKNPEVFPGDQVYVPKSIF